MSYPPCLPPGELSKDFLVQQNGGVLECERANQIAEFKFSDIITRNDHVTARTNLLSGRGLANIDSVFLKKSEGCDKPAW